MKIFKHYKLKPSFSIIKINKTKDRAGVGDKPHPQILADQLILIWYNLSSFNPTGHLKIKFDLILLDPIWYLLIQLDPIWFNLIWFELIFSCLIWFDPVLSNLIQFGPICSNQSHLIHFDLTWTNYLCRYNNLPFMYLVKQLFN